MNYQAIKYNMDETSMHIAKWKKPERLYNVIVIMWHSGKDKAIKTIKDNLVGAAGWIDDGQGIF